MSLHRADSELARINAEAHARPVLISDDLFKVLEKALQISRETDGRFDPTVAPLTQLWGFLWKEHRFPSPSELSATLPRVNYRFVQLNKSEQAVRFATNGITLDLNAIAKGYAVDCAIEKLREHGITNAMVRAGGDLRVLGVPPGETAWRVQIEDPAKVGLRRTVKLSDAALSTSGSYENYFIRDDRRFSHILDPRTGMPVEGIASCTVIASTCMESDAWATALFVLGPDKALPTFGKRFPVLFGVWKPDGGVAFSASASFTTLSLRTH
jgi:FAD:protein FMN transferase